MHISSRFKVVSIVTFSILTAGISGADPLDSTAVSTEQTQVVEEQPRIEPVVKRKSPYALPWQLRSVIAANVIRLDSAMAFYDDAVKSGGFVDANMLTGSYKVMPNFSALVRLGFVNNHAPAGTPNANSFINPLVGGLYSLPLSDEFRLGLFLGLTAPVGMGGGDTPDASIKAANAAGLLARSAMDNALFAVNYFSVVPGVGLAYMSHGLTAQVEATLLQLTRVKGSTVDKDSSRTNFTSGLELGYSLCPYMFVEGELRYQRWLKNDTVSSSPSPAKQNLSFAVGPRFNFKQGKLIFKPGIAYAQGLAGPIAKNGYTSPTNSDKIIFVDLPVTF